VFYGTEQAAIHHERFGGLAAAAAADLVEALRAAGQASGTVVDLGCGSGILARALTDAGYDVLGVDLSPEMLELARATAPGARFVLGSVHDVELPGGCVGVTAIGEVLNYATDEAAGLDALGRLAGRVHDALAPGGTWLLDLSGPGRAGPTGLMKQFHRFDTWCLGMIATEAADQRRLDREITIFVTDPALAEGAWRRIDEHHVLHLYERGGVARIVRGAGLEVAVADTYDAPVDTLPGWYVVRATKPIT
jgi:SAM-dependent methyltransferase